MFQGIYDFVVVLGYDLKSGIDPYGVLFGCLCYHCDTRGVAFASVVAVMVVAVAVTGVVPVTIGGAVVVEISRVGTVSISVFGTFTKVIF